MMNEYELYNDDCLEQMKNIDDKSIDLILTDLPYGTTNCKWDSIIPLDLLWEQYNRIIKDNGAILLFAQTPFDKILGCSNLKMLRYEWIWEKTQATGHFNAKKMPMKAHENILVFYKKLPTYNPQKIQGCKPAHGAVRKAEVGNKTQIYGKVKEDSVYEGGNTDRYPRSVIIFASDKQTCCLHPTQKPVALCEYLIKTYSNENDIVLDSCMGSGTTGIACLNTNRKFIGIEKEKQYFDIAKKRIDDFLKEKNIE
jgi:site-specific DNA-methyltransferase (adenine-specific)